MSAPHQMPPHPTVNHPHKHPAHNKPTATNANNEYLNTPVQPPLGQSGDGMAPPGMFNDSDADGR